MRCSYCYNPHIIPQNSGNKTIKELMTFLNSRFGLLDAVVLSGGEATSYSELKNLCERIKVKGFKIKLDTNGSNPEMLEALIKDNLLDFVAIDVKAGTEQKFKKITGSSLFSNLKDSLKILSSNDVEYECRTTVHKDLLSYDDIIDCIELAIESDYNGTYGLQFFSENDGKTIGSLSESEEYNQDRLVKESRLDIDFRNF